MKLSGETAEICSMDTHNLHQSVKVWLFNLFFLQFFSKFGLFLRVHVQTLPHLHFISIVNPLSEHCSEVIAANKLFSVDRTDLHEGLQLQDYHLEGTALPAEISCGNIIGKLHRRAINLKNAEEYDQREQLDSIYVRSWISVLLRHHIKSAL